MLERLEWSWQEGAELQSQGRLWHIPSCVLGRPSAVPRDWLGRFWWEWAKIVSGQTLRCPELSPMPCGGVQRLWEPNIANKFQQEERVLEEHLRCRARNQHLPGLPAAALCTQDRQPWPLESQGHQRTVPSQQGHWTPLGDPGHTEQQQDPHSSPPWHSVPEPPQSSSSSKGKEPHHPLGRTKTQAEGKFRERKGQAEGCPPLWGCGMETSEDSKSDFGTEVATVTPLSWEKEQCLAAWTGPGCSWTQPAGPCFVVKFGFLSVTCEHKSDKNSQAA